MYDGITSKSTLFKSASECSSCDEEGLQQEESVPFQFRRAKESTSTRLAQFEVKPHENAHPVPIFGVLLQVAKSRKVDLFKEMQEILDLRNVFRWLHNVPLLEWDTSIATVAQSWAYTGVYVYSSIGFRKQSSRFCGESLAWGFPTRTGFVSTQA